MYRLAENCDQWASALLLFSAAHVFLQCARRKRHTASRLCKSEPNTSNIFALVTLLSKSNADELEISLSSVEVPPPAPLRPSQRPSHTAGVMLYSHGVAANCISDVHLPTQHPFIDRISETKRRAATRTICKFYQQNFCKRETPESGQTTGWASLCCDSFGAKLSGEWVLFK